MDRAARALLVLLTVALAVAAAIYRPAVAADDPRSDDLVYVKLQGAGQDKVTLAFQRSDHSIAGFANRTGHWFSFPGYEHLFPESTVLPFSNKMGDLIRDLAKDLPVNQ